MPTLLMFAAIREAAGVSRADVDASTVGEALKIATERFGDRFERILSICTVLHREEPVKEEDRWARALGPTDEIALLPPVSGGADDSGAASPGTSPDKPADAGSPAIRMVDVGDKDETMRGATAVCLLRTTPRTRDRLLAGEVAKGEARGPAAVAGMLAAKRTPELLPHCHPVRTTFVEVTTSRSGTDAIEIRATVRGRDRTGFEMEALTACSIAALTLYDMAKSEDPTMRVDGLRLVAKSGGKSGSVTFP